jgi:serine phosphatase RsbU (regulator of sigma subunit)
MMEISRQEIDSAVFRQIKSEGFSLAIPLINQGELIGLINIGQKLSGQPYTLDDRRFLRILSAQIAPELRIANLVKEYQEQVIIQERIRQELELASLVQRSLLPKQLPEIPDWEIAVHYQPARAVGGDFYDFYIEGDDLVVVVGDVTDKGVPAALVMATTRTVLRGNAKRRLSPGEALKHANNILVPEMFPSMFVTCFYMNVNLKSGKILYANAGHFPPMHRNNDIVKEMMASGMPLGLFENKTYEEHMLFIERGDSVLLYSDGLIEAHNENKEMFGEAKLKELVGRKESPQELIETLIKAIDEHAGQIDDPEDDITLLCLQWKDII